MMIFMKRVSELGKRENGSFTGVAESAGPAVGSSEDFGDLPVNAFMLGHNELRNALAFLEFEGFATEGDQQDLDLTAVIGVDGSR